MARILIKSKGFENRALELRPGVNRIGRDASCDFTISDDTVSSFHCEIVVAASGVTVRDNHSTNGTCVNGEPVQEAQLSAGETLLLGYVELFVENTEFKIPAPALPAPTPPAPVVEPAKAPAAPALTGEKIPGPVPAPVLAEIKLPAPTNGASKGSAPARNGITAEAPEKIQARIYPVIPPPVVAEAKAREPEKIEAKTPAVEKTAAKPSAPANAAASAPITQTADAKAPAQNGANPKKSSEPLPSGVTLCPRHAQTLAIYTCAHCREPLCSACVRRRREPNGRMIMLCDSCLQKAVAHKPLPAPIPPLPQKKSIFGFLRGEARPASAPAARREKSSK